MVHGYSYLYIVQEAKIKNKN